MFEGEQEGEVTAPSALEAHQEEEEADLDEAMHSGQKRKGYVLG